MILPSLLQPSLGTQKEIGKACKGTKGINELNQFVDNVLWNEKHLVKETTFLKGVIHWSINGKVRNQCYICMCTLF